MSKSCFVFNTNGLELNKVIRELDPQILAQLGYEKLS